MDEEGNLNQDVTDYILNKDVFKPKPRKFVMTDKKLSEYFPPYYTLEDIEGILFELLEEWRDSQEESEINE